VLAFEGSAAQQSLQFRNVRIDLEDARVRAELSRSGLRWSELSGKGHGGFVRSRGALEKGRACARLELERVRIGALFDAPLDGALTAAIDLWRGGARPMIARAVLRLDEPRYSFLAKAARTLKRLELPMPPLEGNTPFEACALLRADGWSLSGLSGAVDELSVRGGIEVRNDSALDGRFVLVPERAWLRESRVLSPFASLLGGASVPISVTGSLAKPRVRADLFGWEGIVLRSPLGRRLRATLERLLPSAFERPSRPGETRVARATASLLSTDGILDRLADDPADAAELFEALLERGLSCEEIARRAAER
jgi:hypothetical protein